MATRSRIAALVFALLTIIAVPSIAFADNTSTAEQLFQEGLAAMKRNDYPVACEAFKASNDVDPSPGTQINLAVCYEKQKKWASSWGWYRSAVGLATTRGQKEREQLAEDSANKLKPLLHYIVISIKEPLTELSVKDNGLPITVRLPTGQEVPLPVDPGDHKIEITAKGKQPWSMVHKVPDNNSTDRIEVPKLIDAPVIEDKAGGGGGRGGAGDYQPPIIVTNDGSGQRTIGIIVVGAGLLAGLTCGGMFLLANSEASERDKQRANAAAIKVPDPAGDPTAKDRQDNLNKSADSHNKAAVNNQLIARIFAGGAVVLVGVGAVLYFTAPKGSSAPKTGKLHKPQVLPLLGPNFAGLGLGGSF
jgi:hypothetical protein